MNKDAIIKLVNEQMYLRDLTGKKARIKEKRMTRADKK